MPYVAEAEDDAADKHEGVAADHGANGEERRPDDAVQAEEHEGLTTDRIGNIGLQAPIQLTQ